MKKFACLALTVLMFVSLFSFPASAHTAEDFTIGTVSVEYYEDGSYGVTEIVTSDVLPFSGDALMDISTTIGGMKTYTYYNSNDVAIWSLRVTGTFNYVYAMSAKATSSVADVYLYHSSASFVSKSASTSGATASATTTVKFNTVSTTKTITLTCDKYGNLS